MNDTPKRMYESALVRLEEAQTLSRNLKKESDGAPILSILAMEILLKCSLILAGKSAGKHHKYAELWRDLPTSAKNEILLAAAYAVPDADLSDIEKVLNWYKFIFEKVRYPYEFFEGYSTKDQSELYNFWKSLGAPVNEALIQYHPKELAALTAGMCSFIKSRLD